MNVPGNPSCIPCTMSASSAPRGNLSPVQSPAPASAGYLFTTPSLSTQAVDASAPTAAPAPAPQPCGCKRRRAALFALALVAVYLIARR